MSYGRNFGFRRPPVGGQRGGRFVLDGDAAIPIGVPVQVPAGGDQSDMFSDAIPVELATGASSPVPGMSGIVVYEHAPAALAGYDPFLTTYSDIDTVPVGKLCQLVSGAQVKVWFKNTEDRTFLQTREYAGRTMVAGAGATPTLQVGDYLTPGTGNDTAGYWSETGDAEDAWLVVTLVDGNTGLVEAQFVF